MGWERMQPGCYSNRGWARLCEKKYVLWWQNQMRLGGVVDEWWWVGLTGEGQRCCRLAWGVGGDHHRGWQTEAYSKDSEAGCAPMCRVVWARWVCRLHSQACICHVIQRRLMCGRWVRENPQSLSSSVSIQLCQHDSRSSFSACLSIFFSIYFLLLLPSWVSAYTAFLSLRLYLFHFLLCC